MAELTILCIGDVVGSPGRHALRQGLSKMTAQRTIDCVVVNAENAASGSGLSAGLYQKILSYGADILTLGDHIYRRRDIIAVMEKSDRVVKPANFPTQAPGKEFVIFETKSGARVAVISLMGRLFMKVAADCPYVAIDRILKTLPSDVKTIIVDMHAEATSEKVAMGWHLNGRVSVVFGTHTHVPTADERVLSEGTAYITDVGMTGPYDSVLGRDKKRVLSAMITAIPAKFDVAEHDMRMCGVLVTVDSRTGRASAIERVRFDATEETVQ